MAKTENDDTLINTITLLTAENLLKRYQLNLDLPLLALQLKEKNSICRSLLRHPASHSLNSLLLNQASDHLDYQIKQINILIDREIRLSEDPEQNITGKASADLYDLKNQLSELNDKLSQLRQEQKKLAFEVDQLVQQELADWQANQGQTAHQLAEKLKKNNLQMTDSFENRLRKRLNYLASDCPLPPELIETLIPNPNHQSNPILCSLAYTLVEESYDAR